MLTGGEAVGACYQPTLLADVPADSEFARNETFGPVASIIVVDDADEAVREANATEYGLRPASSRATPRRASRRAPASRPASSHVNDQTVGDEPQMPFGGVKDSGWGRFGGTAAVHEFTELRWITVQAGTRHFPF